MGQIVTDEPSLSRVMLLSDPRSAIPVQIQRNGIRAIVVGTGQNILKLNDISETQDVRTGDLVVTSGLGGRFPLGYPVGKIISIRSNPAGQFSDIIVSPSAHLNQSRLVLLLWPKLVKPLKGKS